MFLACSEYPLKPAYTTQNFPEQRKRLLTFSVGFLPKIDKANKTKKLGEKNHWAVKKILNRRI